MLELIDIVRAGIGRFGPYIERDRKFQSVRTVDQLFTITLEEALELLKNSKGPAAIKELGEHPESKNLVKVMRGRYGPYVTDGKVNATIPKDQEPESVTMDEAVELLKASASKKKNRRRRKK